LIKTLTTTTIKNSDQTLSLKDWITPELHTLDINRDTEQLEPPGFGDQKIS